MGRLGKMGQYFKLVNVTKREYINPYCCGDLAKFVEIASGNVGNLLIYLLRQSDGGGGGDIPLVEEMKGCIEHTKQSIEKAKKENNQKDVEWWSKYLDRYNKELVYAKRIKFAGRWSGDNIQLVGDYDSSKLYSTAVGEFQNITHLVMEEYNEFVGEEYGIYCEEYHHCYDYKRKDWIKEHYTDNIENTKVMIKEGRYIPAERGYEEIKGLEEGLEIFAAEDEYYGKYKEPKWYFQVANRKVEHKGKLAPDMVLTVKPKGSDEQ